MKISQKIKFGNTKEDIDDLAQKVVLGQKIATSSLLDYYRLNLKKQSQLGDYMSILDSSGKELVVVRIVRMEIVKFKDITESFAIEEGDGDLANWKAIHQLYYSSQLSNIGEKLTDDTELICEWFELVK